MNNKTKIILTLIGFSLLSVIITGLFSLFTSPQFIPGFSLAFLAGLSMIFLPCTFPLVFVIVPMALSRHIGKGLVMAVLFGLGLILTFSLYGLILSWLGGFIQLYKIIGYMLIFGGITALVFGISELGLVKFKLPFKQTILPASLQNKNDYIRSFFLGFFLGNAGVGCPNPAFYILFGYVAVLGTPSVGISLGALHGLGRFVPLLFLVVLAALGINASGKLAAYQGQVKRWVGWAMVGLGAFILNYGIFGMAWFENSFIHEGWNKFLEKIAPKIAESEALESALKIPEGRGGIIPWLVLSAAIVSVVVWNYWKNKNKDIIKK